MALTTLVLGGLLLGGCQTSCQDACKKLILDCSAGIPSYNVTQCEVDCTGVQTYYEENEAFADEFDAFQDQLDCIMEQSCGALLDAEAPACYNQDLFAF